MTGKLAVRILVIIDRNVNQEIKILMGSLNKQR